ncbi:MAG TPA: hypothetical protein VK589_08635 [Chryseolinea sp.]|nr:hypothetical protein [Chryseolinea sp.]
MQFRYFLFVVAVAFSGTLAAPDVVAQDEVFIDVDIDAEFPGGKNALNEFIRSNIKYPFSAQKNGIEGGVPC